MKASAKRRHPRKLSHHAAYLGEKHLRHFCDATSHELGRALGTILGELDYALATPNATTRERAMTIALNATERALTLSRNLRYFSSYTKLDIQTADLSEILLSTVELLEKELELKKIKIAATIETSAFAFVDAGAIQQVVLNLLINADQAMPKGGKLTLSLKKSRKKIEISCSDTGGGIPPQYLDHIFEPYALWKAKQATGNPFQTQGLGLSVSKALIEAHGGEIQINSIEGQGTKVIFSIPVDPHLTEPPPRAGAKRPLNRVKLRLPAELSLENRPPLLTEVTVLSLTGCFVRISDLPQLNYPEVGTSLSLRVFYEFDEVLEIPRARVASVCWAGNLSGIGVEFVELDLKAEKLLSAIVKSHSY